MQVTVGAAMKDFVYQQNLARYRRLLEESSDTSERERLRQLIAEEEAVDRKAPPGNGNPADGQ